MSHMLLTPDEVAELLRVSRTDVLAMLEQGTLSGMLVAGEWRIRADSVRDFLREGLERENVRAIEGALNDPAHWATALREFPDLVGNIEAGEHPPDSMGAFLKDALRHNQSHEAGAGNMGTITLYHASGAADFEVTGSAMDSSEAKRILFNARRILTARGQTDAVALLDSAPFAIFPAINNFGDADFHVLQADVPLADYEDFRRTRVVKRRAAQQLAEAIRESSGSFIRFIAVRLQLMDPESWDVFICHASDDKEDVARPLHAHLTSRGISCWIDEAEIAWGDSILGKIQEGMTKARYVIVVLSERLLQKKWAQKELRSALTLEIESDRTFVLPLIVGDARTVLSSLPFLGEKRYLTWQGDAGSVERELRALARKQPYRVP